MPWNLNALQGGMRQIGNQINQGYNAIDSRMGGVLPGGVPRAVAKPIAPGRIAENSKPVGRPPGRTPLRVNPAIDTRVQNADWTPRIPPAQRSQTSRIPGMPSSSDAETLIRFAGGIFASTPTGFAASIGGSTIQPVRAAKDNSVDLWKRGDGSIVGTYGGHSGRWGTAIKGGREVLVPWGSVAGTSPSQPSPRTGGTGGRGVSPGQFSDPIADTVGDVLKKLERPGYVKSEGSSSGASTSGPSPSPATRRGNSGGGSPAPVMRSGNSQQRIVPGDNQSSFGSAPVAFSSIQPGTFSSAFDSSNPLGIDQAALARAAFGNEGFTNKMAIQAEDYSKVLANGLGGNANGFTLAGNLMGGQAPGVLPGASNFAAAAGMNQLVNPVVDAESSIGFPGVVQASFNPAADLVPSGPGATVETTGQEQAAQDFANQAVSRARETQNRMREIRGMPLLVD